MVVEKGHVTPSLVDVSSSADRLSTLSVTEDRAKPVSSTLARDRTLAIATADVTADARHQASVCRAYVTLRLKYVARISTLLFPESIKIAAGAHQLTWSAKAARSEILLRGDDRYTEGL